MNSNSRYHWLALGMLLTLLTLGWLLAAINLTREIAEARLQAVVWKDYALALQGQSLQVTPMSIVGCRINDGCLRSAKSIIKTLPPIHEAYIDWWPLLQSARSQTCISTTDCSRSEGLRF